MTWHPDKYRVYEGPTKEVLEFIYGLGSVDNPVVSEGESKLISRRLVENPFSGYH